MVLIVSDIFQNKFWPVLPVLSRMLFEADWKVNFGRYPYLFSAFLQRKWNVFNVSEKPLRLHFRDFCSECGSTDVTIIFTMKKTTSHFSDSDGKSKSAFTIVVFNINPLVSQSALGRKFCLRRRLKASGKYCSVIWFWTTEDEVCFERFHFGLKT